MIGKRDRGVERRHAHAAVLNEACNAAERQAFLGLRLQQIRQFLEEHGVGEFATAALQAAWLLVQTVRARTIQSVPPA